MRDKSKKQSPPMNPAVDHPQAGELESISWILDQEVTIVDMVHQDLCQGRPKATGARGMSAEQVLRAAIVKQIFGFSYELLSFHLADSNSLQRFCRIGIAGRRFKKSAIAKNVKRISSKAWEQITQNPRLAGVLREKLLKNLVDSGRYELSRRHKYQTNEVRDMIKQTVLGYKLEKTNDLITSHAGLALLGEFAMGLGLLDVLDRELPSPGSGAGYRASEHVFPLVLMLNGGGRSLEDLRQIREDRGLREVLEMSRMPSSDASGDWMRRGGGNGALEGLSAANRRVLKRRKSRPV